MFRNAFRQRRLLVPVSGFYEWQAVPGRKAKQPNWFTRTDGEPVVFAGLWEWWRSPEGEVIYSATIITTDAGPDMEQIHNRQPVVLEADLGTMARSSCGCRRRVGGDAPSWAKRCPAALAGWPERWKCAEPGSETERGRELAVNP